MHKNILYQPFQVQYQPFQYQEIKNAKIHALYLLQPRFLQLFGYSWDKRRVLQAHMCICFSKGEKILHILKPIVEEKVSKQKQIKLGVDGHFKNYAITRYIWSNKVIKETTLKELSAGIHTISNWFYTGNAFAKTWNGRSYAPVVAQKRQLPVSAACILQTPDRNANAKKVKYFLKIKKPDNFKCQCFCTHRVSHRALVRVEDKQAYARCKPLPMNHSRIASVAPITLSNRFHGLPVDEDVMQEHSVENIYFILLLNESKPKKHTLAQSPKIQASDSTNGHKANVCDLQMPFSPKEVQIHAINSSEVEKIKRNCSW